MRYLLPILIVVLTITACKKRCVDEQVGSTEISQEARAYLPYDEGDELTFLSEDGDSIQLIVSVLEEPYHICVKFRCELTTGPYETTPCEYYQTAGYRNLLRTADSTRLIDMVIARENYEAESTLFYDVFVVNYSDSSNTFIRGESVAFVEFTEPEFDENNSILFKPFAEADSIQLLDQTFTNVLYTEEDNDDDRLYYEVGTGLVGIELGSKIYVITQ